MLVICTFIHYCPKTKKNLLSSSQFPSKTFSMETQCVSEQEAIAWSISEDLSSATLHAENGNTPREGRQGHVEISVTSEALGICPGLSVSLSPLPTTCHIYTVPKQNFCFVLNAYFFFCHQTLLPLVYDIHCSVVPHLSTKIVTLQVVSAACFFVVYY